MKKNIHGTGNVCRQVFWNFQAQKRVMQTEHHIGEGVAKDFVRSMFEGKGQRSLGEEAYQCRTVKCTVIESHFEPFVKEQLQHLTGDVSEESFMKVAKVIRNGFYLYSTSCSKVKKQNSYTVALESTTKDGEVGIEIEQFLLHKSSKQVFAVGKLMREMESVLEGYISHMKRLEYSRRIVLKCTSLKEPMIIVKNRDALYGSLFPNHFERD
ncbi:uncharacterized protein LOC117341881 [Pecten maximus]|uniref:uncharacterized protein LOC117341881 n=1 Tax=Pecten maximus TaxID=6579 RepID=UPI001458DB73|nr:uncharacterized protein LOC117341881 [Pecten maximus]